MAEPLKPEDDPFNPSTDHLSMIADWRMIDDILAGARSVRDARELYLPRFVSEDDESYQYRIDSTPWRPMFEDAYRALCSKPFTREVKLSGTVSTEIKDYAEDIDGQGHNLHIFARDTFKSGVAKGVDAIYVTFPEVDPAETATRAAEKASGARPYWVHIDAKNILAVYTRRVNKHDVVQHIRFKECQVERVKYSEFREERVREIDLPQDGSNPTWKLWAKREVEGSKEPELVLIGSGVLTIPVIPVVLFFTGERRGIFAVKPPLLDLANMQMEIYRALSREDEMITFASAPMLTATGMEAPKATTERRVTGSGASKTMTETTTVAAKIRVGPKCILWAPPSKDGVQSSWNYIEPNSSNLTAVGANVKDKITEFKDLAMQPAVPHTGSVTATGEAISAAKAHSAIQSWANVLKDVLEQALVFTCMWIKETKSPEVDIHTDFGVDLGGIEDSKLITQMNKDGQISADTMYDELGRRALFGPQFDKDKEPAKVAADQRGRNLVNEQEMDPFTGQTLKQPARVPGPTPPNNGAVN